MATWYQQWFVSAYYYQLYFQHDEEEARSFIHRLLSRMQPAPGSRVLDAACGRGRYSNLLAGAGFDVTGVDLSHESILFAKKGETESLHFYWHDLRLPFWVSYFDLAFNFFTSFGYFATRREHDAVMRTICQSLKPGGLLLFDYLNVPYTETHLQSSEVKTIGETTYQIERWQDESHFFKRIQVSGNELNHPLEFTEQVAKFSQEDFKEMLAQQNMQVVDVFGDYQLQPYAVDTPRLILLAKKSC